MTTEGRNFGLNSALASRISTGIPRGDLIAANGLASPAATGSGPLRIWRFKVRQVPEKRFLPVPDGFLSMPIGGQQIFPVRGANSERLSARKRLRIEQNRYHWELLGIYFTPASTGRLFGDTTSGDCVFR